MQLPLRQHGRKILALVGAAAFGAVERRFGDAPRHRQHVAQVEPIEPFEIERDNAARRPVAEFGAERRNAGKRGGQVIFADADLAIAEVPFGGDQLLALEDALQELERLEPRQAMLVESRFFGGLNVMETAELLEVSEATVHREWRAAKAWLKLKLKDKAQS